MGSGVRDVEIVWRLFASKGVNVGHHLVSRQLGHVNPQVTAEVYAHLLSDSRLDLAATAFDGLGSAMEEAMEERHQTA
jgi:integrase